MRDWGLPFPRMTSDPLVQFLVEDAVIMRDLARRGAAAEAASEAGRRAAALKEAQAGLSEFKARPVVLGG